MKRIWYILVLLVMTKESFMMANPSKPVPFSVVSAPRVWAMGDSARYIVVTGKNWSKYYASQPENTDFASSVYVMASMGTQPNPGYRIRIVQITQEDARVQVTVEQRNPDPGMMYPQVLVNPTAVAVVKRTDLQSFPELAFAFVTQSGQHLAEVKVEL
jgi:hypothetical protein